jgi:hypothetical protein
MTRLVDLVPFLPLPSHPRPLLDNVHLSADRVLDAVRRELGARAARLRRLPRIPKCAVRVVIGHRERILHGASSLLAPIRVPSVLRGGVVDREPAVVRLARAVAATALRYRVTSGTIPFPSAYFGSCERRRLAHRAQIQDYTPEGKVQPFIAKLSFLLSKPEYR